jgi:hypothetical protein
LSDTIDSRRPVAPEGLDQANREPAPKGEKSKGVGNRGSELRKGLGWAAAGGACAFARPFLASIVSAYGICVAACAGERRNRLRAYGACVLSAVLASALFGLAQLPVVLATSVSTCVVAELALGDRASTGWVCLVSLGLALALIGIDAVYARMSGQSLTEFVGQMLSTYGETFETSANLKVQASLESALDMMRMYWPVAYLVSAITQVSCALATARITLRLRGVPQKEGFLSSFDVPLWVCIAFLLGMVLSMAAPHFPAWSQVAKFVGENVLTASRIALGIQGIAVGICFAKEYHVGPFIRGFLVVVMVWLEVSYVIMSVLGLVDALFANFRDLERSRRGFATGPQG